MPFPQNGKKNNIGAVQLYAENGSCALKIIIPKILLSYLALIFGRYLDVYDVSRWYVG